MNVEIGENVRGCDCFVLQSTCVPANTHLMELLIMIDALRRSSARRITAVIPYYGYARQDRKVLPRAPISAKLVADLIVHGGNRSRAVHRSPRGTDPGLLQHPGGQPLRHARAARGDPRRATTGRSPSSRPTPAAWSARAPTPSAWGPTLAIIDKRREGANVSQVMNIIGDVKGQTCVIVDDIVDTAGTLVEAATALTARRAPPPSPRRSRIRCSRVRPSSASRSLRSRSSSFTDTIQLRPEAEERARSFTWSASRYLLGEAIRRINNEESVSSLFV